MVFTCGNFFSGNGDNDDNDDNDDDDDDDMQVGTLEGTLFLQSGHLVRLSQQALVDCRYIGSKSSSSSCFIYMQRFNVEQG